MLKSFLSESTYSKYIFIVKTRRFIHRQVFNMDKAYLRHNSDGEHFDITFELPLENKVRGFNFSRKLSETAESFLTRVKTNIDKAVNKKKRKNQPVEEQVTSVVLLVNGQEVEKSKVCEDIFAVSDDSIKLSINDKPLTVVIDSPWVLSLALPSTILARFPSYPSKFDTIFAEKNLNKYVWYTSKDKKQWQKVGEGFMYVPSNNDINCYLKFVCTPRNERLEGPMSEDISSSIIQASPGECPFERRHAFTSNKLSGNEFRVVSYNLLADLYCDSDYSRSTLFPYCPPYALAIDYRKQLFLKEIIGYNADIICLQEVDKKVFKYDLEPALSYLKYNGSFSLKGGENGEVAEGLAFFYNTNRFVLLDSEKIVFSDTINKNPIFSDIWNKVNENKTLAERILQRTTIMQVNVIGSLEYDEILLVANTHLYFHPDADHIRLLHGCFAIRYLEDFVKKLKERFMERRVSLIFCGDFNSVPSCGIYQLYTTGSVPGNLIDYSSNQDEKIDNIDMTQPFQLASACGTPKYTNFTAGFADCLDYIYYDKSNLEVSQVIPLPSDEELRENTAIPSIVFPSDHISLVSDLKWVGR